jgi:nitrogen fixation protein NifX
MLARTVQFSTAMKIAFATGDGVHVNEQFRRASQLAVYEVTAKGHRLDRICQFAPDRSIRTEERIRAIQDASMVYGAAYGPSTVLRLVRRGIRAATAPADTEIEAVLARLVEAERDAARSARTGRPAEGSGRATAAASPSRSSGS